jgi:hypothetical protein
MKPPPTHPAGLAQVAAAEKRAGQVGVSLEMLPLPHPILTDFSGSYAMPLDGDNGRFWLEGAGAGSFGHVGGGAGLWIRPSAGEGKSQWAFRVGGAGGTGDMGLMAQYDMAYMGFNAHTQFVSLNDTGSTSFGVTVGVEYLSPLDNTPRILSDNPAEDEDAEEPLFEVQTVGYPVRVLWPSVDFRWEFGRNAPVGFFMNLRLYVLTQFWTDQVDFQEKEVIGGGSGANMAIASGVRF